MSRINKRPKSLVHSGTTHLPWLFIKVQVSEGARLFCPFGIQGVSKVRSDCISFFAQNIYCFFRQMYTDSGKKFIEITFQSNFKLQFEEIIISLKFCPRWARTRGFFSRYFCYPFCRFSIFVFFAAFFYFLYYFTNMKAYTVCATGL